MPKPTRKPATPPPAPPAQEQMIGPYRFETSTGRLHYGKAGDITSAVTPPGKRLTAEFVGAMPKARLHYDQQAKTFAVEHRDIVRIQALAAMFTLPDHVEQEM